MKVECWIHGSKLSFLEFNIYRYIIILENVCNFSYNFYQGEIWYWMKRNFFGTRWPKPSSFWRQFDEEIDEFEDMLRTQTLERHQIKETMGFALDDVDAVGEVHVFAPIWQGETVIFYINNVLVLWFFFVVESIQLVVHFWSFDNLVFDLKETPIVIWWTVKQPFALTFI